MPPRQSYRGPAWCRCLCHGPVLLHTASGNRPVRGNKLWQANGDRFRLGQHRKIPLSLQASFFYTNTQTARVEIVLDFPWDHLKHEWIGSDLHATIGVLGVAYKRDRTVSTRFSDFACCGSGIRWFDMWVGRSLHDPGYLPSHYETQIDLPAGAEYGLRVLLSDGSKFGRAVAPLRTSSRSCCPMILRRLVNAS